MRIDFIIQKNIDKAVYNANNGIVNNNNGIVNNNNGIVNDNNGIVNADNGVSNADNGIVNANNGVVNADNGIVNDNNRIFTDEIAQSDFVGADKATLSKFHSHLLLAPSLLGRAGVGFKLNINNNMKTVLLTFTFISLCFWLSAKDTLRTRQANQWLQNTPLQFTENKGQITENGKPRTDILYAVKGKGVNLHLTKSSIQYTWSKVEYKKQAKKDKPFERETPEIDKITTHTVTMHLLNTNTNVQVIAENQALEIQNYYNVPSAPEGITNVKSYTKIIYKEIYPKIDLVFYTGASQSGLKYDFLVHPGGNPKNIQIQYTGQESINLNADGSLTLKHALGELTEAAPYTYQDSTPIPCHYKLNTSPPPGAWGLGAFISFALGFYDTTLPLTIDPDLIWFASESNDLLYISDIEIDTQNNVYVSGKVSPSGNSISTPFSHQELSGGGFDAFLIKYNEQGVRIWATYYGGSNNDEAEDLSIDNFNNIYLVGNTQSTNNIATPNAYLNTPAPGFIVKFNTSGQRLWGTYFETFIFCIVNDNENNLYISGQVGNTPNFTSGTNIHQNTFGGGIIDAYLAKFSPSGAKIWSTFYGGGDLDLGRKLSKDTQDNIYLSGTTNSNNKIALNAFAPYNSYQGNGDVFLAKFNKLGSLIWATYFGGEGDDEPNISELDMDVDSQNNIYLTSLTNSTQNIAFNSTPPYDVLQSSMAYDIFLVKFSPNGLRLWATYYNDLGEHNNSPYIAIDKLNNVYLTCKDEDFLVKFNPSGTIEKRWNNVAPEGDSYNPFIEAICFDKYNNIYFSGDLYGTDGYIFVTKNCIENYNPMVSIQTPAPDLIFCAGEFISINSNVASNEGSPIYRWKLNGSVVSNDKNFIANSLPIGQYNIQLELVYPGFENGFDPVCIKNNISNNISFEVKPVLTPTITLSTAADVICSANPVTLNASTTNADTPTSYRWLRKAVGAANFSEFAQTAIPVHTAPAGFLKNGDKVKVETTFSITEVPCYTTPTNTITSNELTVNTTPTLTASAKIDSDILPSQSICNGDTLTFYATDIVNEGDAPRFIWKVNNVVQDTTDIPEFSTHLFTPNANNVVSVALLSSYPCLTNANSTTTFVDFPFNTKGNVTPIVTLQPLDGVAICYGEYARFKANPTGGGIEPLYQWFINGIPVSDIDTKDVFASITLQDGDTIQVSMISDLSCAAPEVVSSNAIVMQVSPAPSVSVSLNAGNPICQGSNVTFTATPQNAGTGPITYQWFKDGNPIANTNLNPYTINNIDASYQNANISVKMTTSVACNQKDVTSNPYLLQITNGIQPEVSIKSRQGFPICQGSDAIFEVDNINLYDPTATYRWFVDDVAQSGNNAPFFNAGALGNGQQVKLEYTTTLACANPKKDTSNVFTIITQPLNAPTNLKVTPVGPKRIDLSWDDNSSNETSFYIERSLADDNGFNFLFPQIANVPSYSDLSANPSTQYFYRVRAQNDNIQGCFSAFTPARGAATSDGEIITSLPTDLSKGFRIFPNPSTSGIFQIEWTQEIAGNVQVEVFSLLNTKIFALDWHKLATDTSTSLDLSQQSTGVYYLKIQYNQKQYYVRLLRN